MAVNNDLYILDYSTFSLFTHYEFEIIRETASDILASIGYSVEVAADGAEAVELYKQAKDSETPFDAVIVDLTIPGGMGGQAVSPAPRCS